MAKLEQVADGATVGAFGDRPQYTRKRSIPSLDEQERAKQRIYNDARGFKHIRPAESKLPPGEMSLDPNHVPSKRLGLFRHYEHRFQRAAGNVREIRKLCLMAEVDYERHKGNLPPLIDEAPGAHGRAVERLLEGYVGWDAVEVAQWESCPITWVKRHRILNGMDPQFGEPRTVDPRTARIIELANAGLKTRAIADEVGCHQTTVVRTLNANVA